MKDETVMYGVLEIDYERKWILPIDDALSLFKAISNGRLMKTGYNKGIEMFDVDPNIALKLMSAQELKEKILEASLEGNKDE